MPYLNPPEVPDADGAEFCSVCVCFPDYPEYRAALLGSLHFLSTWVAWERDADHSAAKSAELWRVANEATKENWEMACGGNSLPPVINVTVNNSCGTGGGSTNLYCVNQDGDTIVNPPPVTDYPTEPTLPLPPGMTDPPVIVPDEGTPPDGFADWADYNAAACDAANTLWKWAMDSLLFVRELLDERIFQITTVFALVVNFALGGIGLVLSSAMILKIAELYARLYVWLDPFIEAVDGAIADLEANKQEYICWMYEHRGNVGDWELDLVTKLFNASSGGLVANTQQPLWRDLLSFLIPVYTAVDTLYGSVTYAGDKTGFVACDCGVIVPSGLWAKDYTPTGGTFVHSYDGVTFQQIQYTQGIEIIFGEQWYMRAGIFYVSTTSDLNDTPADAIIRVTNMELTSLAVSVTSADGNLVDSQTLAGGATHDYAGCYLNFPNTPEYTDMIRVSVLSRIVE